MNHNELRLVYASMHNITRACLGIAIGGLVLGIVMLIIAIGGLIE